MTNRPALSRSSKMILTTLEGVPAILLGFLHLLENDLMTDMFATDMFANE
ncbi:MAG: hypothetical protein F6K42_28905 [Leptolyngbya sp. SIO1D8]|nr:hypothetical protein [Leptolyngbya sp. SIO1D8]